MHLDAELLAWVEKVKALGPLPAVQALTDQIKREVSYVSAERIPAKKRYRVAAKHLVYLASLIQQQALELGHLAGD